MRQKPTRFLKVEISGDGVRRELYTKHPGKPVGWVAKGFDFASDVNQRLVTNCWRDDFQETSLLELFMLGAMVAFENPGREMSEVGWGFCCFGKGDRQASGFSVVKAFGDVTLDPSDACFLGEARYANNVAETLGLIELLLWIFELR